MSQRTSHVNRSADQALVREINLSLIMNRLLEHQSLSRAALAEVTGLNKSTVSSLVQELLEMQFVREVGLNFTGVGRPSMLLELNPDAGYVLSCELGVDFISILCANFGAEVIWQHKEDTHGQMDQHAIIDRMLILLCQADETGRKRCMACGRLLGLAVGVPGLVDRVSGRLLFAPNLRWENVLLHAILRGAFPETPVFVENEANMAAMGECFFGAAQGYHEVLFISAGVGLGGAVVRDGQVYKGASGFASEFGHMTMDPDGEPCNCGNRGCWETQVSQAAAFRAIQRALDAGRPSCLNGQPLSMAQVVAAAEAGDAVALDALTTIGQHLGIGIASLINALNPDLVVFGGIMSLVGHFLLPIVEREVQRRALRWNAGATRVILAQHGSDACVMGGVAMVYQAILAHPVGYLT
jgi:glucokinase-like ROK family protein